MNEAPRTLRLRRSGCGDRRQRPTPARAVRAARPAVAAACGGGNAMSEILHHPRDRRDDGPAAVDHRRTAPSRSPAIASSRSARPTTCSRFTRTARIIDCTGRAVIPGPRRRPRPCRPLADQDARRRHPVALDAHRHADVLPLHDPRVLARRRLSLGARPAQHGRDDGRQRHRLGAAQRRSDLRHQPCQRLRRGRAPRHRLHRAGRPALAAPGDALDGRKAEAARGRASTRCSPAPRR